MLADRGYDADWFRDALEEKGIKPCIPGRKSHGKPVKHDKRKYKKRNRIEIMFGRLKDWRRVATRYDRCPTVFFSATCLAATVMFWLLVLSLGTVKKGAAFLNQFFRDQEIAGWLRQNQTLGFLDQIRNTCIAQFGAPRVPSRSTVAAFLKDEGRKTRLGDTDFFSNKPEVAAWLIAEYPKHTNYELRKLCLEKFGKALTPSHSTLQRFLSKHQSSNIVRRHGISIDQELSAWLQKNAPLLRMADLYTECVKRFGEERVGSQSAVYRFLASLKDRSLTRYKSRKEVEEGLKRFHADNPTD